MASEWWDPNGSSAPLHKMNPCRVGFITQQCQTHFQRQEATPGEPLKGLEILDVGCGPGLLSEVCKLLRSLVSLLFATALLGLPTHIRFVFSPPFFQSLARLGGRVHGIDAAAVSIGVARSHASHDPIFARQSGTGHEGGRLTYSNVTAESLLSTTKQYDVVCALEIVEHVTHPPSFINTIGALVKPGGLLIMSTINKTMKSYLLTILGAEYILRMVPVGTHDWNKFISPSALATLIHDSHHPALARFRNFDNQFQPHTPTLPKEATNTWTNEPSHADASSSLSSAPTLGFTVEEVSGMIFNPIANSWYLDSNDVDVNYILVAKRAEQP